MGMERMGNKSQVNLTGHQGISRICEANKSEMISDHMIPKYCFRTPFKVEYPTRKEWEDSNRRPDGDLIWYTDGSKTDEGTGAGIFGEKPKHEMSHPLGRHATVFQTEIFAILECARENIRRAYTNKQILIITDSQAALRALSNPRVTSKLVWECLIELKTLGDRNSVRLIWVPGHTGIPGNEKADELARKGSTAPYIGPEPALGVPKSTIRSEIRDWVKRKHHAHWTEMRQLKRENTFMNFKIDDKMTRDLLTFGRNKLRTLIGIRTGHMAVKGHLNRIGVYNGDLKCRLCEKEPETVRHVICNCEALCRRRQQIFGEDTLDPEALGTTAAKDLYRLVQGSEVLGWVE